MLNQFDKDSGNPAEKSEDQSSSAEITIILSQITVNGILRYRERFRILDVLNKGFIGPGLKSNPDFLTIFHANLTDAHGTIILETSRLYIAKRNVLFVLESGWDSQKSKGQSKTSIKAHPFRNKKPVNVSLTLPGYELEGTMHTEPQMPLNLLLEQQDIFIPMTDITIKTHHQIMESSAGFAAINKNQILYLSER